MLKIKINVAVKEVIDFSRQKCISEDDKGSRLKT